MVCRVRQHGVIWTIVLFSSLVQPGFLIADTTEDRLAALEQRLSRLEQNVERLLQRLSQETQPEELKPAKAEAQSLAVELEQAKEPEKVKDASTQAGPAPAQELVTTTQSTGSADGSSEIQNVPYAGYMETHLNHDGLNPTTFDFHRFVLLFGHGFGDRIRFWSELTL